MCWVAIRMVKILLLGFVKLCLCLCLLPSQALYMLWSAFNQIPRVVIPCKVSSRNMRARLRRCTKRNLQIAWQKHKAACSCGSKRQPFWKTYEAELVLILWNATKLNGFDIKLQNSQGGAITFERFLTQEEAVAHPGKSSLLKKNRSPTLPSDAGRPSVAPCSAFLWRRWGAAAGNIALTISVLHPFVDVAGCTSKESALQDRSCHFMPPALQTHSLHIQMVPIMQAAQEQGGSTECWGVVLCGGVSRGVLHSAPAYCL
jgi:hypothetical protein